MNTELRDPLDDQLRALMRTAVSDAANPPTVADIERGSGIRVAPSSEPRHTVRWVAIAAVMLLALAGGLVWSLRVEHPAKPADEPAPRVDARAGLGAYVLPTSLPEGWRLIDITETAADNTGAISPHSWLIEARDGSTRAVLAIFPAAEPTSDATAVVPPTTAVGEAGADAEWTVVGVAGFARLSWSEQDHEVVLYVKGLDEAQTRAVQADLRPEIRDGDLAYSVREGSPYTFGRDLGVTPPIETGSAGLTLVNEADDLITVYLNRASDRDLDVLLDPASVGAPAVATVDPESGEVLGAITAHGLRVFAFSAPNPMSIDADEIRSMLDSLAPVSITEWDATIAAINDLVERQPIVASASAAAGTLTVHQDSVLTSVCLSVGNERGCRNVLDPSFILSGSQLTDVSVSLLVGEEWVVVRGVNDQDAAGPVEVDVAGVQAEIVSTDVGSFAVLTIPAGINKVTFSIGVQGQRYIVDETAVRPIR